MRARLIFLLAALAPLTSDASETLGKHRPSLESVELLRQSSFPALAVGAFAVAPAVSGDADSVTVRFHRRTPANGESFASYLRTSIVTELEAVGKYDSAATTAVTGELVESRLDGGGSAALAARILVVRSGRNIYDKVLREESRWDPSLLGEVAIPDAFNHYTDLYSKLIVQLFQDDAFKTAIAP
jgi:hypothetical protein